MAKAECLEDDFNKDMHWILNTEHEIGLCSHRFREMVERLGGVETAHRLLRTNPETGMFKYMRDRNRLDLTLEHYVVKDKYRPCFSDDERKAAQWRLDKAQ